MKRNVLGTRIRDFYDIYMLLKLQNKNINRQILSKAIKTTAEYRNSLHIINKWKEIVTELENSDIMKKQWQRYQKDNFYAAEIKYKDLINSIKRIGNILDKYQV